MWVVTKEGRIWDDLVTPYTFGEKYIWHPDGYYVRRGSAEECEIAQKSPIYYESQTLAIGVSPNCPYVIPSSEADKLDQQITQPIQPNYGALAIIAILFIAASR